MPVENPSMKSIRESGFKVQDGFGGNPLDNGNWYMMQPSQTERAIKYGILSMFNREENVFADYQSVWRGYTRYEGEKGGWYDLCKNPPKDWYTNNKPVVETLVKEGYKIKVIPTLENIQEKYKTKWSNPDVFIDGFLSDIKEPKAMNSNAIKSRIKSAHEQGLTHVIVNIPDAMPESLISRAFNRYRGEKHSYSINVLWIYKGMINTLFI